MKDEFLLLWDTNQLQEIILEESNLEGLLIGNVLLLLFFGGYLGYNVLSALYSRFFIYFRHSRKISDPFPIRSSILMFILLTIQWIILIDLLTIFDSYNIVIFDIEIEVGNLLSRATFLIDPFPIEQIIITNALISLVTIVFIYRKSGLGRYVREKLVFRLDTKYISADYFDEIVNEEDPILKNLRITQGYTDLSIAMSQLLGNENTNWATYASWASKTAGQSIRKEEVPVLAKKLLVDRLPLAGFFDPDKMVPVDLDLDDSEIMWNMYILGVIEDISLSISAGNLKVFAELAPIFSSFYYTFKDHKSFDQKALEEFQSQFIPGSTEEGGQDLIKEAFSRYYHVMFVRDPKKKAEMMLLSNIQIGWHEQMRLQEAIEQAVTAPLRHGYEIVMADKISGITPFFRDKFKQSIQNNLEKKNETYHIFVKSIVTSIMVLEIPGKRLVLGQDVPKFSLFSSFPRDLRKLENKELLEVINKFDPDVDSLKASRAYDWSDLEDRLGYIIDLFRTTQQKRQMFYGTFTPRQSKKIYAGEIPKGKL